MKINNGAQQLIDWQVACLTQLWSYFQGGGEDRLKRVWSLTKDSGLSRKGRLKGASRRVWCHWETATDRPGTSTDLC